MTEKPKSKWYWRLLRWGLIGLAGLATLVAVLVVEEDWRGKRDWMAYKQAAEARGERFDWSAFSPSAVPDDQNFAKAPIFASLNDMVWDEQSQEWKSKDTNAVDPAKMSSYRDDGSTPKGRTASWELGRLTSLGNWQTYYRGTTNGGVSEFPISPQPQSPAADVLLALGKYDPAVESLRAACNRPYFRPGSDSYNEREFARMMTWLSRFKGMAGVLELRAIAEMNNQQEAKALEDLQLALRLDDEVRQEPLLLTHLVSIAISSIMLQPIYEGLAEHRWNDGQLAELERTLAAKNFLADYKFAMSGERIFAVDMLENERITGEYKTVELEDGKPVTTTVNMHAMPSAFFFRNELACAQLNEEYLQPVVDVTNHVASPAAVNRNSAIVKELSRHYSLYKFMALATYPAISFSVKRFTALQADYDLAQVACALERYRLAHGEYPASLDLLAPQFIEKVPHDVINGQPLHYRLNNGKFVLYSVGWNEADDGGKVVASKNGTVDHDNGDWVWKY